MGFFIRQRDRDRGGDRARGEYRDRGGDKDRGERQRDIERKEG